MKKTISVLLSILMVFSLAMPAFAAGSSSYRGPIPTILITGDGDQIVDPDGNVLYDGTDRWAALKRDDSSDGNSAIAEAAKNIFFPFLLEGVLQDKWDNYYEAIYQEILDLYEGTILDGNGNPQNGSDISVKHRNENAKAMTENRKDSKNTYAFNSYHFWYDWRLDPIQIADELNDYIEGVKKITKHDKVCIVTRCIGSSVLLAYIAEYGTGSIYGIGMDGSASYGSEFISGALSGDFTIDGDSISRYLADARAFDRLNIDPFVDTTLELLENSGALDHMTTAARNLLYLKIEKGVISAIARATYLTMPCYWALVSADKYETAKKYVFGEEGDPKRTEYAGLIEKLDHYDVKVRQHIPELLTSVADAGANVCIIAKYGTQIIPIVKDADWVGDEYASVRSSSYGATTSKLYTTLTDDEIAGVDEKYISPDKQINASTCLFPDSTYFVKGARHAEWSLVENDIIMRTIQADHQLTADDMEYTRFVIAYGDTNRWEVMTEDNCNIENWSSTSTVEKPTTKQGRLQLFIVTVIKWAVSLVKKLVDLFS